MDRGDSPIGMFDSLKEGDPHAGNLVGGRYTFEGWVVDNRTDLLWFDVPTLREGSVEFAAKVRLMPGQPIRGPSTAAVSPGSPRSSRTTRAGWPHRPLEGRPPAA
ncbi:MAG: hypothetical protein HY897_03860 [Deltaproteobacteria bacterium]|nr:hypothetical protein [Deltaproteobacteria bacterium]